MENQGRLIKVIFLLMITMTVGALLLLALEGKPIKPMSSYNLFSQTKLSSVYNALGTEAGIEPGLWQNFEIRFEDNNGRLTAQSGPTRGLLNDYHFVISDGSDDRDGHIYATSLWANQMAVSPDRLNDSRTIQICLIRPQGYADKSISTSKQARQLETLLTSLIKHCQMSDPKIYWENS